MQNWFDLHFEKLDLSQIKKLAHMKNNTALLMQLLNYGTITQPKDQRCQENHLDWEKALEATDQEISELDDGNVRRSSAINLWQNFLPN